MNFTDEQLAFVDDDSEDSLILTAIAGSGKTTATVGKVKKMLKDGIDPKKIILFSYTNDAVNELKKRIGDDRLTICTIHSYTASMLNKIGINKKIASFYDFVNWYKDKQKPPINAPYTIKKKFNDTIAKFYEDGSYISSSFGAYKLQSKEQGISGAIYKPDYYESYKTFLKETNSRDFSDMLIDCDKLSLNPKYSHLFKGSYDYIFIDEYQDTSPTQTRILLRIEPKRIFLIGDKAQSIFGYSGASCDLIENSVAEIYPVKKLTLTYNFRSDISIVERSNKYSHIQGIPISKEDGLIASDLHTQESILKMLKADNPLVVLVRTNKVIKYLEWLCLKSRIPIKYFNYITPEDIDNIEAGNIHMGLENKLKKVTPYYGNTSNLIKFIKENSSSDKFITSIHKSKGREFPRCLVVNSLDPLQLIDTIYEDDYSYYTFLNEMGTVDQESKNIHYVATTRSKHELYFGVIDETKAIIK